MNTDTQPTDDVSENLSGPPRRGINPRIAAWCGWIVFTLAAAGRLLLPGIDIMQVPGQGLFWMDRLYGWWVAIAFVLSCVTLGRLFMRLPLLRDVPQNGVTGFMMTLTVGWWAAELLLTALGWFTGLSTVPAWLWWVLLAAGATAQWADVAAALQQWNHRATTAWQTASNRRKALIVCVALLLAAWFLPYFIQTLLPDWEWDAANLLMPQARQLADDGLRSFTAENVSLLRPAGGSLLYGLCLAVRGEAAILPLNLLASLGCATVAFALGERFGGRRVAWAAVLVTMTPNLLWELGTDSRVDNLAALAVGGAALGMLVWWQHRSQLGALIVCCMALGVGFAVKTTTFFPAIGFAIALLYAAAIILRQTPPRRALPAMLLGVCVIAVPAGAWYLRNVLLDIHPFGSYASRLGMTEKRDTVPYPPDVVAAAEARPNIIAIARPTEQQFVRPRHYDPLHLFLPTDRHSVKAYQWLSPLLIPFILLPLLRRRDLPAWWLMLVPLGTLIGIGMRYWVVRYATVALPMMFVAAGDVYAHFRRRAAIIALGALLLVQLGWNMQAEWRKLANLEVANILSGKLAAMTWLTRIGYSGDAPALPMIIQKLNTELAPTPTDQRPATLLVHENRTYHIQGPTDTNSLNRMLIEADGDIDVVAGRLREQNVRYLLFNRWTCRRYLHQATDTAQLTQWVNLHLIDRLFARHTKVLAVMPPFLVNPETGRLLTDPGIILARLRDPGEQPPTATTAPAGETPDTQPDQ